MLELKNVSKFYSNKGMISVGFSRVSLKFDIGEFIAITGESGSGKSTLLNVIAGLDSYEEGQMYINGEETSHFTSKDYEEYRKKYIGNIFQNFNLVNSYTVYQNIELVYLLNGQKKKDIKKKVLELIDKVKLTKYKNTRVSKLSGGQKQRVAIARVLALDTPIILADEPTGNLDKNSSKSVLELLHEISKDKLVIVVTHNYDQIEQYVTRKIIMNDGKVLQDVKLKEYEKIEKVNEKTSGTITFLNKIRLGMRNAVNIPSKLLLILGVFSFILFSLFSVYTAFKDLEYQSETEGYNRFFNNVSDKRIIIQKKDLSPISEDEYKKINSLSNIDRVIKNDYSIDSEIQLEGGDYYFYGYTDSVNSINKVDMGNLPENDNEIVIKVPSYYYDFEYNYEEIVKNEFKGYSNEDKYKIVGIIIDDNSDTTFYFTDKALDKINFESKKEFTKIKYSFKDINGESYFNNIYNEILPSDKVKKGSVVISRDWSYNCKDENCKNEKVNVKVDSLYYKINDNYNVVNIYDTDNIKKLTGYSDKYYGGIFISTSDYNSLFDRGNYQSAVFIKDAKLAKYTINDLENLNFKTLYLKDTLMNLDDIERTIYRVTYLVVIGILIIVLFYISYFIIKLILKSRNSYYSTLRVLGSSLSVSKSLINIELLTIANMAYLLFIIFILLVKYSIIKANSLTILLSYMHIKDYILLYLILIFISLLLSFRYVRKLFKDTIINNYYIEV